MEWFAAYLLLGAVAGFLGGMFGIGGGTILVPFLLLMFEAQGFSSQQVMHLALGSSMAIILFTSVSSMRKHHQHGAVDWRVVATITPGILIGTGLGSMFASSVSPYFLTIFFSIFVYVAAIQILLDMRPHASRKLPEFGGMTVTGTVVGWFSALVSIGGGVMTVPFLIWCNVPIRHAIGTASAIGFPIAVGGTVGYALTGANTIGLPEWSMGFVYLPAVLSAAFASVITAPIGAKTAHRLNVAVLRKLFAVLLLFLATKLLLRVFI